MVTARPKRSANVNSASAAIERAGDGVAAAEIPTTRNEIELLDNADEPVIPMCVNDTQSKCSHVPRAWVCGIRIWSVDKKKIAGRTVLGENRKWGLTVKRERKIDSQEKKCVCRNVRLFQNPCRAISVVPSIREHVFLLHM